MLTGNAICVSSWRWYTFSETTAGRVAVYIIITILSIVSPVSSYESLQFNICKSTFCYAIFTLCDCGYNELVVIAFSQFKWFCPNQIRTFSIVFSVIYSFGCFNNSFFCIWISGLHCSSPNVIICKDNKRRVVVRNKEIIFSSLSSYDLDGFAISTASEKSVSKYMIYWVRLFW